jgi:hypothetical protein
MLLNDKTRPPADGWRYYDHDMKLWVFSVNFEGLVENVMVLRSNQNLKNDNYLRQMVEDQICDRQPEGYCSGGSLGDVVHSLAKPVAKMLDRTLGTKLEGCGACAKRRARLNT